MEEKMPAVCECSERLDRSDRRNMMLMISAVLQWMLMLVCIVYLAVLYHHQSHQEPLKKEFLSADYTPSPHASTNCTKIMVTKLDGNMIVQNCSIVIKLTGYYFVYIQGLVKDKEKTGEITFYFNYTGNGVDSWKEQVENGNVRAILLKKLFYGTEVYIKTTSTLKFDQFHLTVYPA